MDITNPVVYIQIYVWLSTSGGCSTDFFWNRSRKKPAERNNVLNSTYYLARTYNWKRLQHSHHPVKFPLQSQEKHSKPWWVTFFHQNMTKRTSSFILIAAGSWKICPMCFIPIIHWIPFTRVTSRNECGYACIKWPERSNDQNWTFPRVNGQRLHPGLSHTEIPKVWHYVPDEEFH